MKAKIKTAKVNERGQIVIPEDMRADLGIESYDTLILIQKDGELVIKKESDVLSAINIVSLVDARKKAAGELP